MMRNSRPRTRRRCSLLACAVYRWAVVVPRKPRREVVFIPSSPAGGVRTRSGTTKVKAAQPPTPRGLTFVVASISIPDLNAGAPYFGVPGRAQRGWGCGG